MWQQQLTVIVVLVVEDVDYICLVLYKVRSELMSFDADAGVLSLSVE